MKIFTIARADSRRGETSRATLWFIAGFLVLVVGGVIATAAYSSSSAGSAGSGANGMPVAPVGFVATSVPPVTSSDWTKGDASSSVSLIEYGDFECPACGEYQPLLQQVFKDYGSRVQFVFREFPLDSIHPDAHIAAQAAEAAGLQGKFWAMHDLLYANQNDWVTTDPTQVVAKYFNGYAQQLGLNVTKFDSDINSAQVTNKIAGDIASGNAAQIDHTPTFFVDLKQIPNPTSYAQFKAELDAALANAGTGVSSTAAATQ